MRRRDWRRISRREALEWADEGAGSRGARGGKLLYGRCSRCGRAFEFKERYERGEEPVYDAASGRWYCSWSCYSRVSPRGVR